MFSSILAASFVAALAPQALANLYITAPVATTTCTAGQSCPITWNDDGTTPALGTIGACTVGLYVGSSQTQFELQALGSVDVSQQASASFIPDATVGGDSNLYFLRFTSENYQVNGTPYEGFSAKFTLTGMTGTFNATVSSLMNQGTSVAASSTAAGSTTPATTTAAGSTTAGASSTGVVTSTTAKASGTSTSHASSTATTSTGAAAPVFGSSSHAVALAAVVVSAFYAAAAF